MKQDPVLQLNTTCACAQDEDVDVLLQQRPFKQSFLYTMQKNMTFSPASLFLSWDVVVILA